MPNFVSNDSKRRKEIKKKPLWILKKFSKKKKVFKKLTKITVNRNSDTILEYYENMKNKTFREINEKLH